MVEEECKDWLKESLKVFPKIKRRNISIKYRSMTNRKLGYVRAAIPQKVEFDHEALLLGEQTRIRNKKQMPKKYEVYVNNGLTKIKNIALRKQVVLHVIMHELMHIEQDDLVTLSKDHKRRKKKKIHINDFQDEIFKRFNELRKIRGIMQIQKREHLDIAIQRTLDSINWFKK